MLHGGLVGQGAAVCEWPRVQPEQRLLQGTLAAEDLSQVESSSAAANAAICCAAAEHEDMQHTVQMLNKLLDGTRPMEKRTLRSRS